MHHDEHEFMVLKPTRRFISFLAEKRPDLAQLELPFFQKDPTAYALHRHEDDDALLNEVERNFPKMLQHEIARWLGDEAGHQLKGSFFDFLCFFKFELHTQVVRL